MLGGRRPTLSRLVSASRSANLVICVLDAARADHFGCYGYPRDTTPNLDRLARESVIFREHFSTCSSTKPSTASLFTGLYPDAHRIVERGALEEGVFTLAGGLKAAGWHTALFSSNVNASPEVGLGAGFEVVVPARSGGVGKGETDLPEGSPVGATPEGTPWDKPEWLTEAFAKWLAERRPSRFFAYIHLLPPHTPYEAPEALMRAVVKKKAPPIARGRFEFPATAPTGMSMRDRQRYALDKWADLYDANLRWGDWGAGEVVRALRERGLLDNTLLIITADHGEAFGEHGYLYHMHGVYGELVHIPLVMRFPGRRRLVGEVSALTQTVDLLPTICDLYQVPYPRKHVQGSSLLPVLDGEKRDVRDYVFATSEMVWPSYLISDSQWSLILYRGGKMKALYNLGDDPGERRNVIAAHPEVLVKMTAAFESFARTQGRPISDFASPLAAAAPEPRQPGHKLSEKTRRELKALGYVE